MRKLFAPLVMLVSLATTAAQPPGPSAVGTWQGTITRGTQTERFVVHITRTSAGGWDANLFLGNTNPIPFDSVTVDESTIDLIGNVGRGFGFSSAPFTGYTARRLTSTSLRRGAIRLHGPPRMRWTRCVRDLSERPTRSRKDCRMPVS